MFVSCAGSGSRSSSPWSFRCCRPLPRRRRRATASSSCSGAGTYSVSGTLDGVTPPAYAEVRTLYVDHIGPGTVEGLRPLAAFKDVRELTLEVVAGVDLTPLTQLSLESLSLRYARDVDVAPLAAIPTLKSLFPLNVRNVAIPSALELPASLQAFSAVNDGYRESGAPVKALVESVSWPRLTALRSLQLQVGGSEPLPPIDVDLGFLRALPASRRPADRVRRPPSRGDAGRAVRRPLSRLRSIRVDAVRPSAVKRALEASYPRASVTVSRRVAYRPGTGSWRLHKIPEERGWHTYGSLWEAFDGRYRGTEYEALQGRPPPPAPRRTGAAAPHGLRPGGRRDGDLRPQPP